MEMVVSITNSYKIGGFFFFLSTAIWQLFNRQMTVLIDYCNYSQLEMEMEMEMAVSNLHFSFNSHDELNYATST
jgi:hypothetical protein